MRRNKLARSGQEDVQILLDMSTFSDGLGFGVIEMR